MTDLASASNGSPDEPRHSPRQNTTASSLASLPSGMDAELRRLEYTHELDVEDRRLKEKYMEMEDRRVTRGQWMGFTISLLILGVLFAAVVTGAHVAAAILAGSAITVGVGSFVYNNRQEPSAQPQGRKMAAPAPEAVT